MALVLGCLLILAGLGLLALVGAARLQWFRRAGR